MNKNDLTRQRTQFAELLREAREARGLSRNEVAQKMGASEETIQGWECGQRPIDIVELRGYCHAIDLDVDERVSLLEIVCEKDTNG